LALWLRRLDGAARQACRSRCGGLTSYAVKFVDRAKHRVTGEALFRFTEQPN
jgi:hypothetical protein